MNYCRTCKYWARRDHMIGAGICVNVEALMRLVLLTHVDLLMTAQDFGCVLHETGEPPTSIYNEEERVKIWKGFLEAQ